MLLKDTVTVNMAADGQVIGVEELKALIFSLQDTIHSHLPVQPEGCSVVNKSRLLYDWNLNHQCLTAFPASPSDVQMCVSLLEWIRGSLWLSSLQC